MSITISDLDALKEYLDGVLGRGAHHAKRVHLVSLALAGAMLWRRDAGSEIKVREQEGKMKNVLWMVVGGKQYVLRYNHREECIELLAGSLQGRALQSFTNDTPLADVERVFSEL